MERDDMPSRIGIRTPARGASATASGLETVAEGSIPNTPATRPLLNALGDQSIEGKQLDSKDSENPTKSESSSTKENVGSHTEPAGLNDSAEKREALSKTTAPALTRPASSLAKRSFTNLASAKNRPAPESMRSMTVETETVSSIPQVVLGVNGERGALGRMNTSASVRPRPSSETIKAKRDKKKSTRKPHSVHSGTVSSKADIFEAKVASAIDETNSSDSEETFVYESNPAERNTRNAHHSRTPSATSLTSQIDQYGNRGKHNARDASQGVAAKKSMKFTNNAYNHNLDGESGNQGSTRSSLRNGSSTPRHHHIGRYGRGGHASLFDADSPFTRPNGASSPRTSVGNMNKLPKPNSPRIAGGRSSSSPKKTDLYSYDLEGEAADDERTPLVSSIRANRSRHARRPFSNSSRRSDYRAQQERSWCARYGACIIVTLLLFVLCIGVGTFVMALNRPLVDVSIKHIQNVLASEQELMLDLDVRATNPNLFAITVNDLDVNVFAKSEYAGATSPCQGRHGQSLSTWTARREQLWGGNESTYHISKGVDKGTDPIKNPKGDLQTMLLGEIFDFDSPLVFEPSPLRRMLTSSVGEVRLAKPGNKTEECGSARWERVVQHPFELHVRGVIKYQLPISSKTRSASIDSRVDVLPKDNLIGGKPTPERALNQANIS
jgi:Vacuolar segregation subunit 7